MPEETNYSELSPEEEIKKLEERLEKKRQELAERGELKEEKETLREVLKERIEEIRPGAGTSPPAAGVMPVISDAARKKADELKKDEEARRLEALVAIAFSESLVRAVHIAEAISPYMLDMLHDTLVDQYYEKLVAARKISP